MPTPMPIKPKKVNKMLIAPVTVSLSPLSVIRLYALDVLLQKPSPSIATIVYAPFPKNLRNLI